MWAQRGETFVVLYPATRQAHLFAAVAASGWNKAAAYRADLALVRAGQLDAAPAGTSASAGEGYRYLGMAWDAAQSGQPVVARSYLRHARAAGANPIEVNWIGAVIG